LLNLVSVGEFTHRNGDCFGLSQNKTSQGDSLPGR
jgi:hypothetical protein